MKLQGKFIIFLLVLILFCQAAGAKEFEILSKKWFSVAPFSIKCIKAEERPLAEGYAKKIIDIVLFIKNRDNKSHPLTPTQTYSFYLQDTDGKIFSSELFGKKTGLYWHDKPTIPVQKDLQPREMVKAKISFLAPADSIPGKLIVRSLNSPSLKYEINFAKTKKETKLFVPEHTLSTSQPSSQEGSIPLIITLGGKLSLFSALGGSSNFMLGISTYHPFGGDYLAKISLDSTSYDQAGTKFSMSPISIIINRDIFTYKTFRLYLGAGAAYVILRPSPVDNQVAASIVLGAKKSLGENILGEIEFQNFSGHGGSIGFSLVTEF